MIKLAKTEFENVSGVHTVDTKKSKKNSLEVEYPIFSAKCPTGMKKEGISRRQSSPITKTRHKSPMTCHPPLLWSVLLLSNQHKPKRADCVALDPTPPPPPPPTVAVIYTAYLTCVLTGVRGGRPQISSSRQTSARWCDACAISTSNNLNFYTRSSRLRPLTCPGSWCH